MEFAVVYQDHPSQVVLTTGTPFEADSQEIAAREVFETFAEEEADSTYGWLEEQGWQVVPLTEPLRRQYERVSNCPEEL